MCSVVQKAQQVTFDGKMKNEFMIIAFAYCRCRFVYRITCKGEKRNTKLPEKRMVSLCGYRFVQRDGKPVRYDPCGNDAGVCYVSAYFGGRNNHYFHYVAVYFQRELFSFTAVWFYFRCGGSCITKSLMICTKT